MVSIGLTLTSLFISGESGQQPMDICDEEKKHGFPSFKKGYVKVRHFCLTFSARHVLKMWNGSDIWERP
jgi:hypothetical protein